MDRFANRLRIGDSTEYPVLGITLCMALLLVSPFVSSLIPLGVFAICLFRVVMYDPRVFARDYCLLIPVSSLLRTSGGMSLLIWLCLFAMIWYFIRGELKGSVSLVLLLALFNYLIIRMQMNVSDFVLCFGHMGMLYVVMQWLDGETAERGLKGFFLSLLISSVYALLLRDSARIAAIIGAEGEAIFGTGIYRFMGLFKDPNYYMTLLVLALAMLFQMKNCGRIRLPLFLVYFLCFTICGILTYSKTFFLMFVLLCGIFVVWQFWNRKIFKGIIFTLIAAAGALYLIYSEDSPFAVVMTRLTTAEDLGALTTGRTDVYAMYWASITEDMGTFLFGHGLAAEGLRKDPHNIYLEILYYVGFVGIVLYLSFCVAIFGSTARKAVGFRQQNVIAKYLVITMMAIMYFALNGMFQVIFHSEFFLVLLALMIVKKSEGVTKT